MTYCFIIDLEKCVGCHGCSVACKGANGTLPGVTRSRVVRTTEGTYPEVDRVIRPMLCMQCENPACVTACPVEGATYRRPEDGIVVIDKEVCTGEYLCVDACPYGARYPLGSSEGYFGSELNDYEAVAYDRFVEGTVDKCDFCLEYNGGEVPDPVCVKACMVQARLFGELEDLQQLIDSRKGEVYLPEEGTAPHVYYLPKVKA